MHRDERAQSQTESLSFTRFPRPDTLFEPAQGFTPESGILSANYLSGDTAAALDAARHATHVPPAAQPVCISIGEVPLSLFLPRDSSLREQAESRYREFSSASSSGLQIFFRPRTAARTGPVTFTYDLDHVSVNLRTRGAEFLGVRNEYGLDSLLRVLLSVVLLPRQGFLLHAATVVRNGRAYVFVGRSGAGKSTVASLSPRGSVLTDEISLLRCYQGQWWAHGTPFWGEFRAAGRNERYPLAGIYALHQAAEDRVEPLAIKQALRALLPCVLFFNAEPRANQDLLTMLAGFAHDIPCNRLSFRRRAAFWKAVAP
jgi:hypothetical protein